MCKRCYENRERAVLDRKKENLKQRAYELLIVDHFKGSEYKRLLNMIRSPDKENLTVVEEIINAKLV